MKRKNTGAKAAAGKPTQAPHVPAEPVSGGRQLDGIIMDSPEGGLTLRPFPGDLLEVAEREPDHLDLAEYWEVIAKLRAKGFTFREIAQWLSERNVDADHNAVYRVYTKYLTMDQIAVESDREERERKIRGEL